MKCPYCGSNGSRVLDKRDNDSEGITRRRRECDKCFKRYTTYERVDNVDLKVKKKDSTIEQYDREKLLKGVRKSVNKEVVSADQISRMIDDVEMKLLNRKDTVVKSVDIGKLVLTRLKSLDPVAYIRFASVYKEFTTLEDFIKEIKEIK